MTSAQDWGKIGLAALLMLALCAGAGTATPAKPAIAMRWAANRGARIA